MEAGHPYELTYSVHWVPSTRPFEERFRRYIDQNFFEHQVSRAQNSEHLFEHQLRAQNTAHSAHSGRLGHCTLRTKQNTEHPVHFYAERLRCRRTPIRC